VTIQFKCPSCQHQRKLKNEAAGRRIKCSKCEQALLLSPILQNSDATEFETRRQTPGDKYIYSELRNHIEKQQSVDIKAGLGIAAVLPLACIPLGIGIFLDVSVYLWFESLFGSGYVFTFRKLPIPVFTALGFLVGLIPLVAIWKKFMKQRLLLVVEKGSPLEPSQRSQLKIFAVAAPIVAGLTAVGCSAIVRWVKFDDPYLSNLIIILPAILGFLLGGGIIAFFIDFRRRLNHKRKMTKETG